MTEPSLLVAHAPLSRQAFDRFVGRSGSTFAAVAARIVADRSEDWLVLRHLGTEEAIFMAFVHRWADTAEEIMTRPYFTELLQLTDFMDEGAVGRVVISAGAMNFLEDEIDAAFTLTRDGASRDAGGLDVAEKRRFDRLLKRRLFADGFDGRSYQEAMKRAGVLDAAVRKTALGLIERRRRELAARRLPGATPRAPVRLFAGLHYNGCFAVWYDTGKVRPLPGLDPFTAEQTPWGARDARHAVVAGRLIPTDPARFRPIRAGGAGAVFRDARRVYRADGEVIAGADPSTFRYVGGGYARDGVRWYTLGGEELEDVGEDGRVDDRLYYHRHALLFGRGAVYLGAERLPVDPTSASVVRVERIRRGGREVCLGWLADKAGAFVFHDVIGLFEAPRWRRTAEPQALWDAWAAADGWDAAAPHMQALAALEAVLPRHESGEAEATAVADFGTAWFAEHADTFLAERPFEDSFWGLADRWCRTCRRLGRGAAILVVHRRLEADAWWRPELFYHAAWAHLVAGDEAAALEAVYAALACGLHGIDDLFADPDLSPLSSQPEFRRLQAFREANREVRRPWLPMMVLRSLAARRGRYGRMGMASALQSRYVAPGEAALEAGLPDLRERQTYRDLLIQVMDDLVRARLDGGEPGLDDKDLYRRVRDVGGLSPTAHLAGALSLFAEGWFWVDLAADDAAPPRPEFAEAMDALGRVHEALAERPEAAQAPLWRELSAHPAAGPFLALAES